MKRICIVVGTRPEAIKMAPVMLALIERAGAGELPLDVRLCVTGQHRQLLDQVLKLFGLKADFDLDLMKPGQDLTDITCSVLRGMREVLRAVRPDMVLVHGDTTTTFSASLAAYYERVPVGHVEAGLRTGNPWSPWPEEINRRLTGGIAKLHFAPTENARDNLLREGIPNETIVVTGNTVIDALARVTTQIRNNAELRSDLDTRFGFLNRERRLVLVTGHRRENFGDGLEEICQAIKRVAERGDVEIVYPVHLNPNVLEPVRRILSGNPAVHLIEPQDYLPFVYLMSRAHLILTDSGGVQEEAPSLGKPVLVMRDTTERPEAVAAGTAELVGADCESIVRAVGVLLDSDAKYHMMARAHNPYGDGRAAERIVTRLMAAR